MKRFFIVSICLFGIVACGGGRNSVLPNDGGPSGGPGDRLNPDGAGDVASRRAYVVRIDNLTQGQHLSPPLVFTSKQASKPFAVGEAPSASLQQLAEEGITGALVTFLRQQRFVIYDLINEQPSIEPEEPIVPGGFREFDIAMDREHPYLTVVAMLANTNDGFVWESVRVPDDEHEFVIDEAFDAGSEHNSEMCAFIPGPPCNSLGAHDSTRAEGRIAFHRGIRGAGELNPNKYNWDEIARVRIKLR